VVYTIAFENVHIVIYLDYLVSFFFIFFVIFFISTPPPPWKSTGADRSAYILTLLID
jgi:hypothetical protein